MTAPTDLLQTWLLRSADGSATAWLQNARQAVQANPTPSTLLRHIGFARRRVGVEPLNLSELDCANADAAQAGWRPDLWRTDEATRLLLLLELGDHGEQLCTTVDRLCQMADVHELVTYYRGLAIYPDPQRYRARAAEGLRTNMQTVFEAVAHHNPYPAEQLDEGAWNQMVLKAIFIGSLLAPIQKLEQRANLRLTRMLCDYAHERWAAGRVISPELWRCVGAAPDDDAISDLDRALDGPDERQQQAAALALHGCDHPQARPLLERVPQLLARIEQGQLGWDSTL